MKVVRMQLTSGGAVPTPAQVFVDHSGRRRRWVRLAGVGVTAVCAGYIGIVVVGLSQTGVGPLEAVPEGGNGEIAGFQNSPATVPGLLAATGSPKAVNQGGHAAAPARRTVAPAAAATRTERTTTSKATTSKVTTSKVMAAPAPGSASSSPNDSSSSGAKGSTGSSGPGSKTGSSKATDSTGSGSRSRAI